VFDHVGVFQYSDEETCTSHELADKVDEETSAARADELLGLQRSISLKKNQARVGQELTVLVEGSSEESELVMVGRHAGQAPEVDGCVYLSHGPVQPGTMCRARVESATEYDLLAEVLSEDEVSGGLASASAEQPAAGRAPQRGKPSAAKRRGRVVSLRTIS
jgi:ribosomal protein S12 methylthiotransferase